MHEVPDLTGKVLLVRGYLITFRDGHETVLRRDETYANQYAIQNHATVEPMFVIRKEAP